MEMTQVASIRTYSPTLAPRDVSTPSELGWSTIVLLTRYGGGMFYLTPNIEP